MASRTPLQTEGFMISDRDLIDHIKHKKYAPLHISFLTYVIYSTQSIAINHKAPDSSEYYNYPITKYTVETFINALLDIILWVKDSIDHGLKTRE